ncbi:heat-shock protein HtpX [Parcubacteria bacterium DG_74_2]|nr:MAG: heat-shock protein HtpX [Parcubacteria bacterium DG_74_2]
MYTQVESNVRRTWILISCFLIFIIFLGWLFSYLLNNSIFLILALIIALFQSFIAYWHSDKIVLMMTGAKPIEKKDNPELYRIVENLSITAGLPTPKIYILPENQPNAFATGRNPEHSAIALTRGLLEKLERPELEGVISHELSHIKNRDILLASVVVVLVGVIAILSNWFLRMGRWGRSRKREKGGSGIFLIFGLIAAILAPIIANLIQLAISRKREFLADASGVLLTRYPEGLIRALEKISIDQNSMNRASPSTAHLFIISPFKGKEVGNWLIKIFSTHPPIQERIEALKK